MSVKLQERIKEQWKEFVKEKSSEPGCFETAQGMVCVRVALSGKVRGSIDWGYDCKESGYDSEDSLRTDIVACLQAYGLEYKGHDDFDVTK